MKCFQFEKSFILERTPLYSQRDNASRHNGWSIQGPLHDELREGARKGGKERGKVEYGRISGEEHIAP